MGRYTAATTEAREMTTLLCRDVYDIEQSLKSTTALLAGTDLIDTVEQLQRLWREEGDGRALATLEGLDSLVHQLCKAAMNASQGGIEFVVADDVSPSHREYLAGQAGYRWAERPASETVVPDGFFEEPTNID